MIAKVHINLNRLALPLPSARGIFPILSLGSSDGSSTFMSSSSCAGGRPDRKQMLSRVSYVWLIRPQQLTLCQVDRQSRIPAFVAQSPLDSN